MRLRRPKWRARLRRTASSLKRGGGFTTESNPYTVGDRQRLLASISPRPCRPAADRDPNMEGRFMRRPTLVRLKVMLVLVLAIVVPERTFRPAAMQVQQAPAPAAEAPAQPAQPIQIPLDLFKVPD